MKSLKAKKFIEKNKKEVYIYRGDVKVLPDQLCIEAVELAEKEMKERAIEALLYTCRDAGCTLNCENDQSYKNTCDFYIDFIKMFDKIE